MSFVTAFQNRDMFFYKLNPKEYSCREWKDNNLQDNTLQREVIGRADKEPVSLAERILLEILVLWLKSGSIYNFPEATACLAFFLIGALFSASQITRIGSAITLPGKCIYISYSIWSGGCILAYPDERNKYAVLRLAKSQLSCKENTLRVWRE